jgi:hypothetical protein
MAQSINTSYAVIVLGDRATIERVDLAEKAAEQGAQIVEAYSFEPGEAALHDDLTEVDAVVAALGRAVCTRTDIWMPFPLDDLGREQHVRRVSLVLQRHGLNILMGSELEPCTFDGGFHAMDFALREEVRTVDGLDNAALTAAAMTTLGAEIERELAAAAEFAPPPRSTPAAIAAAGETFYSTSQVARFFGRSVQWVSWALRTGVFTDLDGTAIEPVRVGKNGRRRFSVPVLRDMTKACFRRGILSEDELLDLLAVLARAEQE